MEITKTGKTRGRVLKRLFRKPVIILQVEERHIGTTLDYSDTARTYDCYIWRDAKVEDLKLNIEED